MATMASPSVALAHTLCALLCAICCLQTMVTAWNPEPLHQMYYVVEIRGGSNITILAAAGTGQGNVSALGWGSFDVFENPLTEGPTLDSKLLGKVTGYSAVTTKGGLPSGGIQINTQHIFNLASEYKNSSITVTGTIADANGPPWECIVPGGTGFFRGYRGYGLIEPVAASTVPPLFVFKWNIYLSN